MVPTRVIKSVGERDEVSQRKGIRNVGGYYQVGNAWENDLNPGRPMVGMYKFMNYKAGGLGDCLSIQKEKSTPGGFNKASLGVLLG